jgi:hypothetical protein
VFVENHRVVGLDPADPIRLVEGYSNTGRLTYKMTGTEQENSAILDHLESAT